MISAAQRSNYNMSNPFGPQNALRQYKNYSRRSSNPLEKYAVQCSEGPLDLNEHMLNNPSETFLIRVTGDSMLNAGIREGDMLVVDRSKKVADRKIVVAEHNNSLLVKRYRENNGSVTLVPENNKYNNIEINSEDQFNIWGVVTSVIRSLC